MMFKAYMKRRMRAFATPFGYDAEYLMQMIDADTDAGFALAGLSKATGYKADAPKAAWYAAKIVAAMSEDCGACTQLAVDMANRAGVASEDLRAIVGGNLARMSPEALIGYRFAKAVLARDPEIDTLRDEIVQRWGRKALGAIALCTVAGRTFPRLRFALGHGDTCQAIEVGGIRIAPNSVQHGRLAHA
jgi:hypothetical protein